MGVKRIQKPPSLGRAAPSFRLRNNSLDALRSRRVFDLFDSNRDGEITSDELCRALNLLGLVADEADISSTISGYLKPGRTGLDYDGFRDFHRWIGDGLLVGDETAPGEEEEEEEEDMRKAFAVFDENGDGFISAAELQAVLRKLGVAEASDMGSVKDMISSVDSNGDGRVDILEFKRMMKNVRVKGP